MKLKETYKEFVNRANRSIGSDTSMQKKIAESEHIFYFMKDNFPEIMDESLPLFKRFIRAQHNYFGNEQDCYNDETRLIAERGSLSKSELSKQLDSLIQKSVSSRVFYAKSINEAYDSIFSYTDKLQENDSPDIRELGRNLETYMHEISSTECLELKNARFDARLSDGF